MPLILPFVLYHGKTKWKVSNRLRPLFEDILFADTYIPDFGFEIIDIYHIPDDQIRGELLVRAFLLLLKYIGSEHLFGALPNILNLIDGLSSKKRSTEIIEIFLRYLIETVEKSKTQDLKKVIKKSLKSGGTIMPTIADELKKEGIKEGKIEGKFEGKIEGKIEDAEKIISKGMTNADIRDITGLSIKEISEIRNRLKKR